MRCINCKEKFEKKYPNQMGKLRFCLNKDECITAFWAVHNEQRQKKAKKDWKQRKKTIGISAYSNKHKKVLQENINLLSRMIDDKFHLNCIDCNRPLKIMVGTSQDKLVNGAHFHNVHGNEHIRFNLHNVHAARTHCNLHSSEHKPGYKEGLKKRYGQEYYEYVEYELRQHPSIKLTEQDIFDKKVITNKLIRDFHTFNFLDSKSARNQLNEIIGIYNKPK